MSTEIITLTIEAKGEIISSNFPAFAEMVRERLAEINRDLKTDEDFDQADADAKAIAGAESALKLAKAKALQDAEQLHALFEKIYDLSGDLAKARLDLSKQINAQKENVKTEIIEEALASFDIDASLARKHYINGLATEIKGKRTMDSMRKACRIYATTQQVLITACRKLLDSFEKAHGADLISDRRTLELEKPEGLEAELRRRFEAKRAADEKKILEVEAAKAKAELAAAQAAKMNPHNLPDPPKIGSIPVGNPTPANVVPMNPAPLELTNEISEDDEWRQVTHTVKAAFALIKEHRERLTHQRNIERLLAFGADVNAAWTSCRALEMEAAQ